MKNFNINNPVKIAFGAGRVAETGNEAKIIGKKALVITGGNSSKKAGALDKVLTSLKTAGVEYALYDRVTPNPKAAEVDAAAELGLKEGCDFVIGLGGGSPMDAAKGAAVVMGSGGRLWDYVGLSGRESRKITKVLPVMLIPTLAATGSEGNCAAVFTNTGTNQKSAIWNPLTYPKVSIVDPALTLTVPAKPTAEGIIDIIMHVLEEYITGGGDCTLQDRITEGVILTCIESAEAVLKNPADLKARADISLASTVALQGLPNSGRAGAWVVHPMEHAISGLYDHIAHGSGIAAILPSYIRFASTIYPARIAKLSRRIFNCPEEIAGQAEELEFCAGGFGKFIEAIGLPSSFKELGLGEGAEEKVTAKLEEVSGIPGVVGSREAALGIYRGICRRTI